MTKQTKGFVLATLGSLCASMFFIPYKMALETTDVETYLLAVYIIGFLFSLTGSIAKGDGFRANKTTLWVALVFALLSVIGNYGIGRSMEGIDPAITALLTRTQIIIVMFLGWFFLKEAIVKFLIPGTFIALSGFVIMNYHEDLEFGGELAFYWWGLLGALCFGATQVILKAVIHTIEPVTLNFIRLLIGGLIIATIPGVMTSLLNLSSTIWMYAAAAAFFGPLSSRLLYMYSARNIPVSQLTLFIILSPIFTALLSWLLLDQFPTNQQLLGAVVILVGMLLPIGYLMLSTSNTDNNRSR